MIDDIAMSRVPAGNMQIAGGRGGPRRILRIEPFEIGVFAVTQEQVAELIGEGGNFPRRPATGLSWFRAVRLCNAASEWEGFEPAYTFDGEDVTWHLDSDGYRLPSEAEWEYACRAGSTAAQYGPIGEVAWTARDGLRHPADVGGRLPNLHGMFDTLGNVWEWCWDLLDADRSDDVRVFRGGGFLDDPQSVGASVRRGDRARSTHPDVGLRFARGPLDAVPVL